MTQCLSGGERFIQFGRGGTARATRTEPGTRKTGTRRDSTPQKGRARSPGPQAAEDQPELGRRDQEERVEHEPAAVAGAAGPGAQRADLVQPADRLGVEAGQGPLRRDRHAAIMRPLPGA